MKRNIISVKILRCNPDIDPNAYTQTYEVPYEPGMSVHSLIQYIYRHLDNTIAFRNYNCFLGVCNTCLVCMNGKNVRACTVPVEAGQELIIEPAKEFELIRDLAVDLEKKPSKKGQ